MTFEEMLSRILKLRDKANGATVKFFEFLIEADTEYRSLWEGRYKKFTLFLAANNVCEVKTFELYRLARASLGVERVRDLGVEASIKLYKESLPVVVRGPRRDYARLEAENGELRRRVETLEKEKADLEKEKADLKKRLAKYEKRAA